MFGSKRQLTSSRIASLQTATLRFADGLLTSLMVLPPDGREDGIPGSQPHFRTNALAAKETTISPAEETGRLLDKIQLRLGSIELLARHTAHDLSQLRKLLASETSNSPASESNGSLAENG